MIIIILTLRGETGFLTQEVSGRCCFRWILYPFIFHVIIIIVVIIITIATIITMMMIIIIITIIKFQLEQESLEEQARLLGTFAQVYF